MDDDKESVESNKKSGLVGQRDEHFKETNQKDKTQKEASKKPAGNTTQNSNKGAGEGTQK